MNRKMEQVKRRRKRRKLIRAGVLAGICTLFFLLILSIAGFFFAHLTWNVPEGDVQVEYAENFEEHYTGVYREARPFAKEVPVEVIRTGVVDTRVPGDYTVTYHASYRLKSRDLTKTVHVIDTIAPEITLTSDPSLVIPPGSEYPEEGYQAFDLCDGDLTDQVNREVDPEAGTVTYTVSDAAGNSASVVRQIPYGDIVPPEIYLAGSADVTIYVGDSYSEQGYSAWDAVDGDLSGAVVITSEVDSSAPGDYLIHYSVADAAGNGAGAARIIRVIERPAPPKPVVNPESPAEGAGVIYLTFDDGPGPYTGQLLDVLDKYGVKATFFVTNQYPDYIHLIGEAHRRGHKIAIHTYDHHYEEIYSSEANYWADWEQMAAIVQAQTGTRPNLFRFPGGSSNMISRDYSDGIMSRLAVQAGERGLLYCDWNVSSGDGSSNSITTEEVVTNLMNGITKLNCAAVTLQHDTKAASVAGVEQIIVWALQNGYRFDTLQNASQLCHHTIAN